MKEREQTDRGNRTTEQIQADKEYRDAYYAKNKQSENERTLAYSREHREEIVRKQQEKYYADIEESRRKARESAATRTVERSLSNKKWYEKNKRKSAARVILYNARMRQAYIEEVDYEKLYSDFGSWCYICDKPIELQHRIEYDHVIPISRGGPHAEFNIRPVHKVCNRRKKDKLLEEMDEFQRRGL